MSALYIKIANGLEMEIPLRDIRLRRVNLAPDGSDVEDITVSAKPIDWLGCAAAMTIAMGQMERRGVSLQSFLHGGGESVTTDCNKGGSES